MFNFGLGPVVKPGIFFYIRLLLRIVNYQPQPPSNHCTWPSCLTKTSKELDTGECNPPVDVLSGDEEPSYEWIFFPKTWEFSVFIAAYGFTSLKIVFLVFFV